MKMTLAEKHKKDIEEREEIKILENLKLANERVGIPQIDPQNYDQADYSSPTYEKMGLTKEGAVQIFLDHRYLPRKLLAEKYGAQLAFFHERMKPINIIQRIYQDIVKKPERYEGLITDEDIKSITIAVADRTGFDGASPSGYGTAKSVKAIIAQPIMDHAKKYEDLTDKAANLLELIFSNYKNKKDVKSLDIKKAVDVLKALNDMKKLEKGEATEHVAHYVKTEELDKLETSEIINMMNTQRSDQQ